MINMASVPAQDEQQRVNEGQRNPAQKAPSQDMWFKARETIRQMYVVEDMPLKRVRKEMDARHNFLASERMYKQRLKEWGLDQKKVKAAEWRYMLRVTLDRRDQGKETAFLVNNKPINWSQIRKHLKRKKETDEDFLASGPEYEGKDGFLRCFTPTNTTPSQDGHAADLAPVHRSPFSPQSSQASVGTWTGSSPYNPYPRQPCSPVRPFVASTPFAPFPHTARRPSNMTNSSETVTGDSIPDTTSVKFALRWIKASSDDEPVLDNYNLLRISGLLVGTLNGDLSSLNIGNLSLNPTTSPPSEDELASKWILSYFQAAINARQNNIKAKEKMTEQGARAFSAMLNHQNAYLLPGLTYMTSIMYWHDHRDLCIEFLKASCAELRKKLKTSPLMVPYEYMLQSVGSGEITIEWQNEMSVALKQSYEQFTVLWGVNHANTLSALYYTGFCLTECHRFDEAEACLLDCLDRSEKHLTDTHILTIYCAATLARTIHESNTRRGREAIAMQERALRGCAKLVPTEHPYSLELLRLCAEMHWAIGDVKKCEELYTVVLQGRMTILGVDSPTTASTEWSLRNKIEQQQRDPNSNPAIAKLRDLKADGGNRHFAITI